MIHHTVAPMHANNAVMLPDAPMNHMQPMTYRAITAPTTNVMSASTRMSKADSIANNTRVQIRIAQNNTQNSQCTASRINALYAKKRTTPGQTVKNIPVSTTTARNRWQGNGTVQCTNAGNVMRKAFRMATFATIIPAQSMAA